MKKATCILKGDGETTGVVRFEQEIDDGPVKIFGTITGLAAGNHSFNIHQYGDGTNGCISAGPHFNPHGKKYGAPQDSERHVGDLRNVLAKNDVAEFELTDGFISLHGPHSIIGRTVVVHEKQDDLGKGGNDESLVTGNAGGRLACGVVGICQ